MIQLRHFSCMSVSIFLVELSNDVNKSISFEFWNKPASMPWFRTFIIITDHMHI